MILCQLIQLYVLLGSTVSRWLLGWLVSSSCSIGRKLFLDGLVDQLFQSASNGGETVEEAFASSRKDYSQELLLRSRKRLKKRSIEKRQPNQSKPFAVKTVYLNRTRSFQTAGRTTTMERPTVKSTRCHIN